MSYLNLLCQGYTIDEVINLDEARKRLATRSATLQAEYGGPAKVNINSPEDSNAVRRFTATTAAMNSQHGTSPFKEASYSVFGDAKFQSPKKEMLVKHIIPRLIYHVEHPSTSESHRSILSSELDRHLTKEAIRIDSYANRIFKKLAPPLLDAFVKGLDPKLFVQDNRKDRRSGHDVFDHGYTGALPTEYGEIVAGYLRRRINKASGEYVQPMTAAAAGDSKLNIESDIEALKYELRSRLNPNESYYSIKGNYIKPRVMSRSNRAANFMTTDDGSELLPNSSIPIDHLISWSRSFK